MAKPAFSYIEEGIFSVLGKKILKEDFLEMLLSPKWSKWFFFKSEKTILIKGWCWKIGDFLKVYLKNHILMDFHK